MHHLQSIERACHLKNKDLLKLSFWCRVKYYYSTETEWGTRVWIYVWPFDDWIKTFYNWNSEYVRQYEILWHPITLQDILLCLWDDWAMQTWNNQHFSGQFYPKLWYDRIHDGDGLQILRGNTFWLSDMYPNDIPRYDLTKSPYDQLPEVLQFLAENLTK